MTDTTPIATTLRALTGDTQRLLSNRLRPIGVTVPQFEFLAYIAANPKCCGADAAEAAHVSPQTGTTVLANLAAKKLITVGPAKGHRNALTATARGTATLAQAQDAVAEVEKRVAGILGEYAVHTLVAAVAELQPHLPKRGWQPTNRPVRTKTAKKESAKRKTARRASLSAGTKKLDLLGFQWTSAMAEDGILPGHVAQQFGSQEQIDALVAAGRWETDGDGYRINH